MSDDDGRRKREVDARELETASFGAGCFWCTEAVYEKVPGVVSAVSGYQGGHVEDPTYREVCTGNTGHAEVLQIKFDPDEVDYKELLDLFWRMHDPTTPNRQGADVGPQYRSVIFVYSDSQREAAEASRREAGRAFDRPIVTKIEHATTFYPAEKKHQDYYRSNSSAPYCRAVIRPKLKKLGME